eukprot:g13845.t1
MRMLYMLVDASAPLLLQGMFLVRMLQLPRLYTKTGFARWVRRWFHQSSREVRALANVIASMFACFWFLHLLTCSWFFVGSMEGAWASAANIRDLPMLEQGLHSYDIRSARRAQKETQHQVSDFFMIYPVSWDLELQEMSEMLPEFLYREICREALTPFLWKHAVLHDLATRHQCFQYDLCVQCMVDWNVGSHEMLFSARTKCDNMLIIAQGTIAYQKSASDFLETRSTCTTATTMTTIASAASLSPRPSLSNLGKAHAF